MLEEEENEIGVGVSEGKLRIINMSDYENGVNWWSYQSIPITCRTNSEQGANPNAWVV